MKIYIGNLSFEVTEKELRQALEQFGKVESVTIIKDKYSDRSKGFGFAEMASRADGQSAINGLNSEKLKERVLVVNEARPRVEGRGNRGRQDGSSRGGRRHGR